MQRMRGRAAVSIGTGGLERLAQAGSAKAFLPRTHAATPEIVFLNTAGGLTGGDRLRYGLSVGKGAWITGTTQTAERAYRAGAGEADVDVDLRVGAGGRVDWLPQETILFEGAGLARRTEIHLDAGAACLLSEMVVLGREAMGETVTNLSFTDMRRVFRSGRPVWTEPLEIGTSQLSEPSASAGLEGARAFATVAFIAPAAEDRLSALRACIDGAPDGLRVAASGWDGKLILRAVSTEPAALRRVLRNVLEYLRGAPLPRVWQG
ncbi:urease accessory protein UreD [Rhodophyticola sp. MJ-SS7]|nr:urease accessory protein UreD [Rhodophyticola sp. MJ-SS7]